jgi:hypothetical protein
MNVKPRRRKKRKGGGFSWSSYWTTREPSALVLTVVSDSRIDITWTDSAELGADGYKVYISTDNATWTLDDTVAVGAQASSITGLTQVTLYYVKVVAYKGTEISTGISSTGLTHPTALYDSNTNIWLDSKDLSTITKDVNEKVSIWADKLGSVRVVQQTTAGKEPEYTADGIVFAGDGKYLAKDFTQNQPTQVYIVVKPLAWTDQDFIFDGWANNTMSLRQNGATPKVNFYAGAFSADVNLSINEWHIVNVVFNGLNSVWQIDNVAEITGNLGTNNSVGLTVGSNGAKSNTGANMIIAEVITRIVADSAGSKAAILDYLSLKYSLGF